MDVFLTEETKNVQITGNIGYAPVLESKMERYEMLRNLVPVTFQGGWSWGTCGFYEYYGLKNVAKDGFGDLSSQELPVIEDTMFYTIKGSGNNVLIELK